MTNIELTDEQREAAIDLLATRIVENTDIEYILSYYYDTQCDHYKHESDETIITTLGYYNCTLEDL